MKFLALLLVACVASSQANSLNSIWEDHDMVRREAKSAQKIGPVNILVSAILEGLQKTLKGLDPVVQGVYHAALPSLTPVLEVLGIFMCQPKTVLDLFLWDTKEYINGPLYQDLGVAQIPFCKKLDEKAPTDADRARITGVKLQYEDACKPGDEIGAGPGKILGELGKIGTVIEGEVGTEVEGSVHNELEIKVGSEGGKGHHGGKHRGEGKGGDPDSSGVEDEPGKRPGRK